MQSSIRNQLFWGVTSLIGLFVLLSWFLNFNFLDKYYISQKGAALHQEFLYIDRIYQGDFENIRPQVEKLVQSRSTNIVILDQKLVVKYEWHPRPPGLPKPNRPRPAQPLPPFLTQTADWSKPALHVDAHRDGPQNEFLNFTAKLHNGDYLWLGTPLPEIQQSVAISNQFFLLTGILTILIGGIAVRLYSRKFTRPILELNIIAQSMAKLDFTKMYPVQTDDEIGELGRSINSLSEQLGRSIAELRQANYQLELDNERQRQIDENRKEFISNVSHELKTPIALIQGYSEGLQLNVAENEEDKNFYCGVIMDEANKMNKLVRNLLDLSEIDSGYLQLEREVFDLGQLTERVIEKYQLILKDRDIHLTFHDDGNGMALVEADLGRIEQVLVNYINNALEHIDEERRLELSVLTRNEQVRVTVFNSGKAIPAVALEKIWFSFYKVDQARTRDYGGTGLGLSIVRAILERHHGRFGAENRPGGVEFWFELQQYRIG